MRYWFDCEFVEDGKTIDLISIGIVAEDGRQFYAECSSTDLSKANQWVQDNVIGQLWHKQSDKRTANAWSRDGGSSGLLCRKEIARYLIAFCDPAKHGPPEFWADFGAYDWVCLCQIFGTMMDLPTGWPFYCRDIRQLAEVKGNPILPKQTTPEHHALNDALYAKECWEFLSKLPTTEEVR